MAVQDKVIEEALDLMKLALPKSIPVIGIRAEDYTDSTGEAALRVRVMLDEGFDAMKVSGKDIGDLKWIIGESLRDHGVTLFPYIFLAKPSELATDAD